MSGKVEIWNMALSHLGVSAQIQNPDEKSKEANQCRFWYDQCRQELLKNIEPNWANRRIVLAAQANPITGWGYKYAYPGSALEIIILFPQGEDVPARRNWQQVIHRYRYEVSSQTGSGGKVISSNVEDAEVIYVYDVEDTQLFDPNFKLALSLLLAQRIAMVMTGEFQMVNQVGEYFRLAKGEAIAANYDEHQNDEQPEAKSVYAAIGTYAGDYYYDDLYYRSRS